MTRSNTDSNHSLFAVYLRGMLMGIADLVPGISGGTVAFMTGIYARLINALSSFNPKLLKQLVQDPISKTWREIDGNFLIALFAGIFTSIFAFAQVITFLLDNYPLYIWALFFGLVAGSVWYLMRSLPKKTFVEYLWVLAGTVVAWFIVELKPVVVEPSFAYVVFCGAIAISAMVLPGISGSFILLLLGVYPVLLGAVNNGEAMPLIAFVVGAVIGLMTVSKVLKSLLSRYYTQTIAVLTGFLLGSIKALWPWRLDSEKGEALTLLLPSQYESMLGVPSATVTVTIAMIVGTLLVVALTLASEKRSK